MAPTKNVSCAILLNSICVVYSLPFYVFLYCLFYVFLYCQSLNQLLSMDNSINSHTKMKKMFDLLQHAELRKTSSLLLMHAEVTSVTPFPISIESRTSSKELLDFYASPGDMSV